METEENSEKSVVIIISYSEFEMITMTISSMTVKVHVSNGRLYVLCSVPLQVEDSSSHRNAHEGDFLIALCRYLVQQGYSPSCITVLATYSGQMFYLRNVSVDHVF